MRTRRLASLGAWFHQQLQAAKEASGSCLPVHVDDPTHDHMVGATLLMLVHGNAPKGVRFYNAWARFAGYAPIALLRERPVIVDVQDAIIEASLRHMEILQCQ